MYAVISKKIRMYGRGEGLKIAKRFSGIEEE